MSRAARGVERGVAYVAVSERRRVALVGGVSALFLLGVAGRPGTNLGLLPVGLAAALAVALYTRDSAGATVAASAAGTGLLCLALYAYQVVRTVATASTEPIAATLVRLSDWLVLGLLLVAIGAWIHRTCSR